MEARGAMQASKPVATIAVPFGDVVDIADGTGRRLEIMGGSIGRVSRADVGALWPCSCCCDDGGAVSEVLRRRTRVILQRIAVSSEAHKVGHIFGSEVWDRHRQTCTRCSLVRLYQEYLKKIWIMDHDHIAVVA